VLSFVMPHAPHDFSFSGWGPGRCASQAMHRRWSPLRHSPCVKPLEPFASPHVEHSLPDPSLQTLHCRSTLKHSHWFIEKPAASFSIPHPEHITMHRRPGPPSPHWYGEKPAASFATPHPEHSLSDGDHCASMQTLHRRPGPPFTHWFGEKPAASFSIPHSEHSYSVAVE